MNESSNETVALLLPETQRLFFASTEHCLFSPVFAKKNGFETGDGGSYIKFQTLSRTNQVFFPDIHNAIKSSTALSTSIGSNCLPRSFWIRASRISSAGQGSFVATLGSRGGINHICQRQQPPLDRNISTGEALGIPFSIPSFMVVIGDTGPLPL